MSAEKRNPAIVSELHQLAAQNLISAAQLQQIAARYPTGRWDLRSLIRWFTIFGALCTAGGLLMIAPRFVELKNLLDGGLVAAIALLIFTSRALRNRGLLSTATALELLAGFCVQGLTISLAIHYSTGSDNWPALVGVDTGLILFLAYLLKNRLILIHACVNFFLWFGGSTGYSSSWGAYWLGMDYPLRFLVAGLFSIGVSQAHERLLTGVYQSFSRVYDHFGLLVAHLAMWFFSLFGYFEKEVTFSGNEAARMAFSVAWALACTGSIIAGASLGRRTLRAYGLLFLIIDLYTFYFQFVVPNTLSFWFLHLLLVGGSLLWLGVRIEKGRRAPAAETAAPMSATGTDG